MICLQSWRNNKLSGEQYDLESNLLLASERDLATGFPERISKMSLGMAFYICFG